MTRIGEAMRVSLAAPQSPLDLVLHHLAGREMLLVLDNFENLREASPLLDDTLRRAPGVRILVTSRQRLGAGAEWLLPVEGLAYPAPGEWHQAERFPAVQLFVERARRVRPDFSLISEREAVCRICAAVDGLPLAIELAADWVRALGCAQILGRVEAGVDALSTSASFLPERHRRMRTVLEQSWSLLDEAERLVFRRLSVFGASVPGAAAEEIAGATPAVVAGLIDRAFLRRKEKDRLAIHELLREYGAERLEAPEEERETREKHARYYARWITERRAELQKGPSATSVSEIEDQIENLRSAWKWLVQRQEVEAVTPFAEVLWLFFQKKGWFREATFFLEEACSLENAPTPPASALVPMAGRGALSDREHAREPLSARRSHARARLRPSDDAGGSLSATGESAPEAALAPPGKRAPS